MKALILAAGCGERLVNGLDFPKPLKRVGGVPLMVRTLRNLETCGVREVGVVVGYMEDVLRAALAKVPTSIRLHYISNPEWMKPNGVSVLAAEAFVTEPTALLMCDHLWAPALFRKVAEAPCADDEALLGIDKHIARCPDLPDATKVRLEGDRIVQIGKTIDNYQAIDTGVFKIGPSLIEALKSVNKAEGCSLSDGVKALADRKKMRTVDIGHHMWIDVDTPHTHAVAEQLIQRYGVDLAPKAQSFEDTARDVLDSSVWPFLTPEATG